MPLTSALSVLLHVVETALCSLGLLGPACPTSALCAGVLHTAVWGPGKWLWLEHTAPRFHFHHAAPIARGGGRGQTCACVSLGDSEWGEGPSAPAQCLVFG